MRLIAENSLEIECGGPCPLVAMLRPRSGADQWVVSQRYEVRPWVPATEYDDSFGNLCQRFTLPQGASSIRVTTEVEVAEQITVDPHASALPVDMLPNDTLVYLLQSRYCPSDKMSERAQDIVRGVAPGYMQVERIRQWIYTNITYEYGASDETTCALDTLRDGAGVCRDFAHVAVALCRSLLIPARVVVGYLHELEPMDMHAWFEAYLGDRWYTFDATQETPRAGRIVVAHGRDIADVAFISNYGELEITEMDVSVRQVKPPARAGGGSR